MPTGCWTVRTTPGRNTIGAAGYRKVLLSGDHERIRRWRLKQSLGRTLERRPDLLQGRALTPEEETLLAEYRREQEL